MSWLKQILCLLSDLLSSDLEKPRPYKVNPKWIKLERDEVDDALKDKKYDDS